MITIEQVRKKLPDKYKKYSDEQIQKILDFFYAVGYLMFDLKES